MNNDKVLTTLKKARSHIDKIINMIEEGKYCIEIIQQLNAISGYINSAKYQKLENHLNSCFIDGMESKNKAKRRELVSEVLKVTKMSN